MQLNTVVIPDKQIINLINNIDDEFKIQQENFEQLIKCYCNQIFILYYRGIYNQRQYNITSSNTTIVSIIEYINKNYNKDISLNKLSLLYNYSPEYISRLFPIKTGFNLTDYINHVRIKNAKIFLKDKSIKINEVCFLCGFGSLTHFGRVFKSITGYSPSIYKKRAM